MSDVLSLSQIKMPGTARTKDDAIREAGEILVTAGATRRATWPPRPRRWKASRARRARSPVS